MKSYVSIEQAICPVCGEAHDTGTILLDCRLRPTLNQLTPTHYALCPEHQQLFERDFIALVAIDESLSTVVNGKVTPENAYRTREIIHIKKPTFVEIFHFEPPSFVYVESEVIRLLTTD